eukprot:CAMPEP_0170448468 /NCGR_PEP_ID=MMETSP0117_2-20130122/50725_1 /TAXON_ID=400756 /ORGANISM="Durinskia baltica, Strain CSIRO CS-38" /LENGTH=176 /DNA_ID=CAMNT_0010709641 /DNA_START=1 /DNA_END=532 /DNA_ORIENTATION=+
MEIDWSKVDVTTFSWQKVLGGEGAHGVMILSPRAVQRLQTYDAQRPLPKIFRMTKKGKDGKVDIDRELFEGATINTPSMLCVEDYLDALQWSDHIGGLPGLIKRSEENLAILEKFVEANDWVHFLASDPTTRSSTSVCLIRDAPDGLRIWCGATVEKEDLQALMPWLKWAYETVKA